MSVSRLTVYNKLKSKGFTLLEVLVALLILTIVMGAVLKAIHFQISGENHIKEVSTARWIGMNVIAKMQSALINEKLSTQGEEKAFGQRWYWQADIQALKDPMIKQVEVSVGLSPDEPPIIRMEGFVR